MSQIKYRIKVSDSSSYPFRLERKVKFFGMWDELSGYTSAEHAESDIARHHTALLSRVIPSVGTIVKIISNEDLTAIMLKG